MCFFKPSTRRPASFKFLACWQTRHRFSIPNLTSPGPDLVVGSRNSGKLLNLLEHLFENAGRAGEGGGLS